MKPSFEKYSMLLSGFIDGELSPEEAMEVQEQLQRSEALRKEYEELIQVGDALGGISFIEPGEAELENLWKSPFGHLAKMTGLFLVVGGYLAVTLFGLLLLFTTDEDIPAVLKFGFSAMSVGALVLLIAVIRDRFISYQHDPYKELKR